MHTLTELRRELKPLGFKVRTETLSWGRHATYTDMEGEEWPSLYFNDEQKAKWKPLRDFLDANSTMLADIKHNENLYGLQK